MKGLTERLYCSKHKLLGMVNVKKNLLCVFENCEKRPIFNTKGEPTALYCFKHKLVGMVDITHKMCVFENCTTRPTFNILGEKAEYCFKHKSLEMVDLISKPKNPKPIKLHKIINKKNKTCVFENCKTLPSFNMKGQTERLYCAKHKKEGMINVINQLCIFENCKTLPSFNTEGEPIALYCTKHKKDGMINVKDKTCIHPNCKTIPNYNKKGEPTALYCVKHKKNDMIDIKNKTCKTYLCPTHVQTKYEGYCLFCYIHIFPDKPVSHNYKTKEFAVVEHVKTKYNDFSWCEDKRVQDGCSKRRPDLLLDLGYQIIIVEIDENQHINYDCSCENKRIMELSQDLGHRPIIFIRFNPDDYVCEENKISSCWGNNKNGICVVKKTKQKEWTERLITLEQQIDYWINPDNVTDKTIETIQLFYDI
jgi:hypothetical protein